jgi:hypothetical protein
VCALWWHHPSTTVVASTVAMQAFRDAYRQYWSDEQTSGHCEQRAAGRLEIAWSERGNEPPFEIAAHRLTCRLSVFVSSA